MLTTQIKIIYTKKSFRGVVKRYSDGLQNHYWGFDSFRPCHKGKCCASYAQFFYTKKLAQFKRTFSLNTAQTQTPPKRVGSLGGTLVRRDFFEELICFNIMNENEIYKNLKFEDIKKIINFLNIFLINIFNKK